MGTVLPSGTAGILWGNAAAITPQTHCLMRKKSKDKCGCIQGEFGSSNVAHTGSLRFPPGKFSAVCVTAFCLMVIYCCAKLWRILSL